MTATFGVLSGTQAKTSQARFVILWFGAILSLTTLAYAQSPDPSVSGHVADSSKGILAGAHTLAVNVSTNISYEATINGAPRARCCISQRAIPEAYTSRSSATFFSKDLETTSLSRMAWKWNSGSSLVMLIWALSRTGRDREAW
jgi:hypothetical protein